MTISGSETIAATSKQGTVRYSDGSFYIGQLLNGVANGKGKMFNSKKQLICECVYKKGKLISGRNYFYNDPSDVISYTGSLKYYNGIPMFEGNGTMVFYDGTRYIGQFRQNNFNGPGVLQQSNGKIISGLFLNGNIAYGTIKFTKGYTASGQKNYFENTIYTGEIIGFSANGQGKVKSEIDGITIGTFKDDLLNGYGDCTIAVTNYSFKGIFKDGKKNGYGEIYDNNGDHYIGDFQNDLYSGQGKLIKVNGDVYEGQFNNNKLNGQGKLTLKNGDYYSGSFSDNSLIDGNAKTSSSTGDVYEGHWSTKNRNGIGKGIWANGDFYEGDWKNGERTGKGKYSWPNGNVYEGDWVNAKMSGKGKFTWPNGTFYEGDWLNGERSGKGKFTWPNGTFYEGYFDKDLPQGEGTINSTFESEGVKKFDTFTGTFNGTYELNGFGIETIADSTKVTMTYKGEFKNGIWDGKGIVDWSPNDKTVVNKYVGEFNLGKLTGQGTRYQSNGFTFTGTFIDGALNGQGEQISPDGTITTGIWIYGEPTNQKVVSTGSSNKTLTARDIAKYDDAIATIYVFDRDNNIVASGSGFSIYKDGGMIITNSHVVKGGSFYHIYVNKTVYNVSNAQLFINNPELDIAAFAFLPTKNETFAVVSLNQTLPEKGDKVYAYGSPNGLTNSLTEGIVSNILDMDGQTQIQHTAYTDHGSSGGALFNENGEVIAITSAISVSSVGIENTSLGYAIPISYFQTELNKFVANK